MYVFYIYVYLYLGGRHGYGRRRPRQLQRWVRSVWLRRWAQALPHQSPLCRGRPPFQHISRVWTLRLYSIISKFTQYDDIPMTTTDCCVKVIHFLEKILSYIFLSLLNSETIQYTLQVYTTWWESSFFLKLMVGIPGMRDIPMMTTDCSVKVMDFFWKKSLIYLSPLKSVTIRTDDKMPRTASTLLQRVFFIVWTTVAYGSGPLLRMYFAILQKKKIKPSTHRDTWCNCFSCYRVAKTHRIPYLYRSFSAKEPHI